MIVDDIASNSDVLAELGHRLKRARIAFPLTQAQLAARAGVSTRTVANLEAGSDVSLGSLISVLRALGLLSRINLLVPEEKVSPADVLAGKPRRQRVRTPRETYEMSTWKWGDEQ